MPRKKKRATKQNAKRRSSNPSVYDSAGKLLGKFSRKAAKIAARAVGGTVGKPKAAKNPKRSGAAIFKTKAAATAFAKANRRRGVRISIKKLSKGR